jgi:carboxylate-amine ligase
MSRLAPAAVVRHQRFGAGPPYTVGIEEEYMLLDPQTFELVPRAEELLAAEAGGPFADCVAPELFASLVEFHTPVCAGAAEAGRALRRIRRRAVATARTLGLRLGSAGTHPFSLFERQPIMERKRYRMLIDELQYAGRRELIYGLHVHVAVDDPDRAIRIVDALRAHLCELVALSANSPFWRGEPTGFASCRHLIFSAFPRSGPPPHFDCYEQYAGVVDQLVDAGAIEDYTRIWWDVRPHPMFGTLEVRVMDAVSRVDDAVALAAYVQALVRRYDAGNAPGRCHPVLANENKWRAARYGLDGIVVDTRAGGATRVRDLIDRTLAEIAPYAIELGCECELDGIYRILLDGNGATRQLEAHAAGGDGRAVARAIADDADHCVGRRFGRSVSVSPVWPPAARKPVR